MPEYCGICGCELNRNGKYASPTIEGRSHATSHHYIASRFNKLVQYFPWKAERKSEVFCYECHEELLHNPILLPKDIELFSKIVKKRKFDEGKKVENIDKHAKRIVLFHEVIAKGLQMLAVEENIVDGV